MSDVPVYFCLGDDNKSWEGIPRDRALEWTQVFLRRRPSVPGTMMRMIAPNLAKGIPAGFTDWAHRAQVAEAIGFTPSGMRRSTRNSTPSTRVASRRTRTTVGSPTASSRSGRSTQTAGRPGTRCWAPG